MSQPPDGEKVWRERILPKLTQVGECWEWSGYRNAKGYGQATYLQHRFLTHRLAYELLVGPIPEGLIVMHACDNPPCCNPNHLRVGTRGDNQQDMARKRRSPHLAKTHCPKNHPYDEANTIVRPNGARACRECKRADARRYMAQKRAERSAP